MDSIAFVLLLCAFLLIGLFIGANETTKTFLKKGVIKRVTDKKTGDKRLIWADGMDFKYE